MCPSQKLYVYAIHLLGLCPDCEFAFFCELAPLNSAHVCVDRLTFNTPRRPYERERLDQELRICGEYGLRCKREIWRVQLVLAKIRKVGFVGWLVM